MHAVFVIACLVCNLRYPAPINAILSQTSCLIIIYANGNDDVVRCVLIVRYSFLDCVKTIACHFRANKPKRLARLDCLAHAVPYL